MDILKAIALGLPMTLLVTAVSLGIGSLVALPLLAGLRSGRTAVRFLTRAVIDILRGIPPIVWLFVLFYGISVGTFKLSAFWAGVIGLGVVAGAYLTEIFRGALGAVNAGQWEASEALGLDRFTLWTRIIGPQGLRVAIPGFTTYGIGLLKDSSIVSTIGVAEIVYLTQQNARMSGQGIVVYFIAAAIYIMLSMPLGMLSRNLDIKMRKAVAR
ncbi:polar amino acid transport system permease protein [Arthrobacter globiformis]|uniref:amino acid ABC transporter permease n=1 Tax=Arthrobacter globiformis TaxID=1665 RepID=UPI002780BF93|nr:amino acid ABC transporter permease [Arthrobacter globiformis]MDQ1056535.1 polar amino acid transport system permease protein [Arthrobacter globiformis]